MNWDILNIIGTIAFALSGAIIAMEEEYDLLGVYVLGFVTSFGGGAIRNLLIGLPISTLWQQQSLFIIAFVSMTVLFYFPKLLKKHWIKFGNFLDALGLAAFSIQGALYSVKLGLPVSATITAAILTGCGGGMIRDLLAGRKPLVFKEEIYVVWAIITGAMIGMDFVNGIIGLAILFVFIVILRMVSLKYNWKLPKKNA